MSKRAHENQQNEDAPAAKQSKLQLSYCSVFAAGDKGMKHYMQVDKFEKLCCRSSCCSPFLSFLHTSTGPACLY